MQTLGGSIQEKDLLGNTPGSCGYDWTGAEKSWSWVRRAMVQE